MSSPYSYYWDIVHLIWFVIMHKLPRVMLLLRIARQVQLIIGGCEQNTQLINFSAIIISAFPNFSFPKLSR